LVRPEVVVVGPEVGFAPPEVWLLQAEAWLVRPEVVVVGPEVGVAPPEFWLLRPEADLVRPKFVGPGVGFERWQVQVALRNAPWKLSRPKIKFKKMLTINRIFKKLVKFILRKLGWQNCS
jgi:hypothetical protein